VVDLLAGALGLGQLQVPARVVTAAPSAQGDAPGGQPQVGGVEVDRDELVAERAGDLAASPDSAHVRHRELSRHVELVLDFDRHASPHLN
jgi:hypothetical protein